jgi:alpha-L-fucosidase
MFDREVQKWNPAEWARLFRATGARYAVLTTKHHDGFRLWPSRVPNPKRATEKITAKRDLVGDLTKAVRAEGLKMGLYYSGGLDWTFEPRPIATMEDLKTTAPQSEEYARYADAHWRELIERYQPAVLWNDITYPKAGKLTDIFSEYYNRVPDGVIDNRFGVDFADFTTPEYAKYDKITAKKWESCRGLGFSFGYNRVEGPKEVIAADKLVALLADIVSKNGNLLLNIGPRPDGSISEIQLDRLHALGRWLKVNGEAIFDTQPWVRASAGTEGPDVRFTQKDDTLYAILLARPGATVAIPGLNPKDGAEISALGGGRLEWSRSNGNLVVQTGQLPGEYAWTLKIRPAPAAD